MFAVRLSILISQASPDLHHCHCLMFMNLSSLILITHTIPIMSHPTRQIPSLSSKNVDFNISVDEVVASYIVFRNCYGCFPILPYVRKYQFYLQFYMKVKITIKLDLKM